MRSYSFLEHAKLVARATTTQAVMPLLFGVVDSAELTRQRSPEGAEFPLADKRQCVLLKVQDPDAILFADQELMVFGRYVRCSRSYLRKIMEQVTASTSCRT
jgi:hypothetical protein